MDKVLRICHVVSGDLWGGAEAQVYQLVRCIVDRGDHQVFVITLNKGVLFDRLMDMSIDVSSIEETKMRIWEMIFKIRSFLKTNKIDLVHCHGFKENLLAGFAVKMFLGCVVVRTHHGRGVVSGSLSKALIEKLNTHLLTNKMIAVSHELKLFLVGLGFSENKIEVIHNGIDCKELTLSKGSKAVIEQHSIPSGSFIIGTASRIEHEKGHQYLLLVVKELIESDLPVVLVIVGDGNLKQKYQQMAQEMNISKSVIFTGFQENVCNYLNIFDLFVMMSLNEGIPLALIEAMCMGKAVVCSAVGGIPEVVKSNVNGILVPTEDYRSCAAACHKILSQKDFQLSLGINARQHVLTNFSSKQSAVKTINLYENTVKK